MNWHNINKKDQVVVITRPPPKELWRKMKHDVELEYATKTDSSLQICPGGVAVEYYK